jgi:hypothetical protein
MTDSRKPAPEEQNRKRPELKPLNKDTVQDLTELEAEALKGGLVTSFGGYAGAEPGCLVNR